MSSSRPDLPTLGSAHPDGGFLQVLLSRLEGAPRAGGGVAFRIELTHEMQALVTSAQKALVTAHFDADTVLACERAIRRCRTEGEAFAYAAEGFALRHASGGALVRLARGGHRHDLLFLRDIAPEGWNIANGASQDAEELARIDDVIRREVEEEVLFHDGRNLYVLGDPSKNLELAHAVARWQERLGTKTVTRRPPSFLEGPDSIEVIMPDGRVTRTEGLHVIASAEDFSLECVRVAEIQIEETAVPLDGEILKGALLDRVVTLSERPLQPASYYRGGAPHAHAGTHPPCPVTERLLRRL